jgi:putative transposase
VLYGQLRKDLGGNSSVLALHKEDEVVEGPLKIGHVHMLVSIPPKYSVAQVVGYLKGKSAIWVAKAMGQDRIFLGQNFCARGYCVSTVGLDERAMQEYIRSQEEADKKLDQFRMFE